MSSPSARRALLPSVLANLLPIAILAALFVKLMIVGRVVSRGVLPPGGSPYFGTLCVCAAMALPLWRRALRSRLVVALILNALASIIALGDLWTFRWRGDVLSVSSFWAAGNLLHVPDSVLALAQRNDWWIFGDLVAFGLAAFLASRADLAPTSARWRNVLAGAMLAVSITAGSIVAFNMRDDVDGVLTFETTRSEVVGALGLPGYHLFDLGKDFFYPFLGRLTTTRRTAGTIADTLLEHRRNQMPSALSGVANGLNVIVVNAESLEGFALGLKVDGRSITPNLDAFQQQSLNFEEFYEQTHTSSTSDAEFITLNSQLPLTSGAVATNYERNEFVSLAGVLGKLGYVTLSACGESPSLWNMGEIHERYGFTRSVFISQLVFTRQVGAGLDDAAFFEQLTPVFRDLRRPFFSFLLTSGNHHPFELPEDLAYATPNPLPGTLAGRYLQSVAYFDSTFGRFLKALTNAGVLDESMIVVYGDHRAWLKDADLQQVWQLLGNDSAASPLDLWRLNRRVPLMIRLPGGRYAGNRSTPGGQLDIAPTVLSLLGQSSADQPWLGRDLTSVGPTLIPFRDGSVTDGRAFAIANGSRESCYRRDGSVASCRELDAARGEAQRLQAASDDIIAGNLAHDVSAQLAGRQKPQSVAAPVLMIAHRGDAEMYPENTLPAIASALNLGADYAEVDVRLSRDGVPMIFHDDTLERTTNGRGPFSALTRDELKRLDAGGWKGSAFKGLQIPTLAEAVAASRGRLYLDLKNQGMGDKIAAIYRDAGLPETAAFIATWSPAQLADAHRAMPGARVLTVGEPPGAVPWDQEIAARTLGMAWGIELSGPWSPAFVDHARQRGVPVLAYTVNDEETLRRLLDMGVIGVETDALRTMLKVLRRLHLR